ncbi:MAG TPA: GspE/PulE family protein [Elusimicrobiota bacterium]|nr:GspE/PulE family protein [Elusimicrobiota bacterium]
MEGEGAQQIELPLILDLLLQKKLLTDKKVQLVLREQERRNCGYVEAILHAKAASEEDIAKCYAEYFKIPAVFAVDNAALPGPEVTASLKEKLLRDNNVLPLRQRNGILDVVFLDPTDLSLAEEIQLYTGMKVNVLVGPMALIGQGLSTLYKSAGEAKEKSDEEKEEEKKETKLSDDKAEEFLDLDRIVPDIPETQVMRMVNNIVGEALRERASDIHMEPYQDEVKVRLRIDGSLNEIRPPPMPFFVPVISRLKILAKMDIAEKKIPQDGAFAIKRGESRIDVRVSTIPTLYGEKMVMRILNKEAVPLDLSKLGFDKRQCEDFIEAASAPHGLLFVTGPTGSGKSTSLYATLNLLKSPRKNILTVEDPVEYRFTGINQVQTKAAIDLTFSRVLRAFLRQDPDVIMVGEVRDNETAQICMRAALTGHFVLSTLHTNDALAAVTRLQDMGIEAFLLASTLRLVEAQRLVRRLCPKCKVAYSPSQEQMDKYHFDKSQVLYRPKGCPDCRDAGYKGRVGIFEVFRIVAELQELIQNKAPLSKMHEAARKAGMQTMLDNGLVKVREGLTSLEEVTSVTVED